MPNHSVAQILIREGRRLCGRAQRKHIGRPNPTLAEHVIEDLNGKIDMIIDGGSVGIGLESTIVDFTEEIPTILRPGHINEEMLEGILGEVRMDQGLIAEDMDIRQKAPGMKYRHYAPRDRS